MAKTSHYYEKFIPDCFYHVYNRAIDRKSLFIDDGNYRYFLQQYDKYLSSVVETYSYALMGNHFHFGIKIRSIEDLTTFKKLSNLNPDRDTDVHMLVAHQFQRFFQSYAMAFNKQQNRTGTLFQTPFKRCWIDSADMVRLILYHHLNPVKHRFTTDYTQYPWTSFNRYMGEHTSKLPRRIVWDMFNGRDNFVPFHQTAQDDLLDGYWVIEDE